MLLNVGPVSDLIRLLFLLGCGRLFVRRRLGLTAGDRHAIVFLARGIVILFLLWSLFFGNGLLFFFQAHDGLSSVANEIGQLVAQVVVPLFARRQ